MNKKTKTWLENKYKRLMQVRAGSVYSQEQEEGMLLLLAEILYDVQPQTRREVQVFVEKTASHYTKFVEYRQSIRGKEK